VNAVMTAQPGPREAKREIDEKALRQFLQWLSEDSSIAGKEYLRIRQLLVTYFTRKACDDPDRLADTTLDRAVCVIAKGDEYATPGALCYGIARNVWREYMRERKPAPLLDDNRVSGPVSITERRELEAHCLETCLNKLPEARRDLISRYYQGCGKDKAEARKRLAQAHGGEERLRIKAFRIRQELRKCIDNCVNRSSRV
jgi:DNA-directed RNA polymerase specialized sigma24 family protein